MRKQSSEGPGAIALALFLRVHSTPPLKCETWLRARVEGSFSSPQLMQFSSTCGCPSETRFKQAFPTSLPFPLRLQAQQLQIQLSRCQTFCANECVIPSQGFDAPRRSGCVKRLGRARSRTCARAIKLENSESNGSVDQPSRTRQWQRSGFGCHLSMVLSAG